jgi:hypothetical protein
MKRPSTLTPATKTKITATKTSIIENAVQILHAWVSRSNSQIFSSYFFSCTKIDLHNQHFTNNSYKNYDQKIDTQSKFLLYFYLSIDAERDRGFLPIQMKTKSVA